MIQTDDIDKGTEGKRKITTKERKEREQEDKRKEMMKRQGDKMAKKRRIETPRTKAKE
ncbi:hypothetical protein K0M31_013292 [Melipona bicolor]|uniref:Uncharacterized protein n=1 Tax=Melipona bicolor TaxID=60889 RepID=A0AA40FI33_9HYME|nr:hypothetical protein K0M31_013292 [Melipona bicolor]